MKLTQNPKIDLYRHMAFAAVGGFFGAYAILCRGGALGSSQTLNLLELLTDALFGRGTGVLQHLGAFFLYVLGTALTVPLPHFFHADMHYVSPAVTAAMAVLLGFLPEEMPVLPALYPIFFAMSMQWSSFGGAQGFVSASIFSTNNVKQTTLALTSYLCEHDRTQLHKAAVFACTLLCFHIGAAVCFFAVKLLFIRAAWVALPLIAWAAFMAVCERKYEALAAQNV